MAQITLRGAEHYYQWVTQTLGHPTGKPVLVFVHGWGGSSRYWQLTAQALVDQYDCLLYDLRGFGRSKIDTTESDYSLESYAQDLNCLLDQLQVKRISLMAHSLGTSISVFFLNQYAERVDRAILTCAGIFDYRPIASAVVQQVGRVVSTFRPRWFYTLPRMEQLLMQPFLYIDLARSDQIAFVEDFLSADTAAAMGTLFDAVSQSATERLSKQYAHLSCPTLLISGQYDAITPAALGQVAAQLNATIQHQILPNVGHFPMLEDPDSYLAALRSWLKI